MAQQIKWYERPGQWFRNVLHAPRESQPAPRSLGRTLKGEPASLDDHGEGLLLVCFWASWCSHCREELPQFEQLARKRAGPRFKVLAVNVHDDPEAMARWLGSRTWAIQHHVDTDGAVARAYAISPLPTSVLVDARHKTILKRWEGLVASAAVEAELDRHLAGRKRAPAAP